jgi:hypothetical protein
MMMRGIRHLRGCAHNWQKASVTCETVEIDVVKESLIGTGGNGLQARQTALGTLPTEH